MKLYQSLPVQFKYVNSGQLDTSSHIRFFLGLQLNGLEKLTKLSETIITSLFKNNPHAFFGGVGHRMIREVKIPQREDQGLPLLVSRKYISRI